MDDDDTATAARDENMAPHLQILVVGYDLDDAVPDRSADEVSRQRDHLQHLVHVPSHGGYDIRKRRKRERYL